MTQAIIKLQIFLSWILIAVIVNSQQVAAQQRWTATLSQARYSLTATTVGDLALFAGGGTDPDYMFVAENVVDIFHASNSTWTTATLSQARGYLAATSTGDLALFAGGVNGYPLSNVDIFHAGNSTWTTATLSQPRSQLAATTVGDLAVFAGGVLTSNVVDIFHASNNSWTTATLSQARYGLAATTIGDLALFAGGYSGDYSNVVDVFHARNNTWTTATLSQARSYLAATTIGDYALFGGGYGSQTANVVDIFHAMNNTWTTATLSQARYNLVATTVGDLALFAGGYAASQAVDIVDVYNFTSNSWTTATLSQPRREFAATTVNNLAIFAGGRNQYGTATLSVEIWQYCFNDSQCDDGLFCNEQVCINGNCILNGSPCPETACQHCQELTGTCLDLANTSCNDDLLCNGFDTCDNQGNCLHTGDPCVSQCYSCVEGIGCTPKLSDTPCEDGIYCNGANRCDGTGNCKPSGFSPCAGGNTCSNQCNETTHSCYLPAGALCLVNGTSEGVCDGVGGCLIQQQIININNITNQANDAPNAAENYTGMIVGIVAGIIALLTIGIAIAILCVVRKRRQQAVHIDLSGWTLIENIEIQERLGGGNFGDVFRGLWNGTTEVALKLLKNVEHLKEFAQEASILQSLNHPNIVRYLGIYTSPTGDRYIVTEFLSKGSSDVVLAKDRSTLTAIDLLAMAKHAAAGMLYLEQQKIIHRDLALRNLLATQGSNEQDKYVIKVADFGLSRSTAQGYYKTEDRAVPYKWTAPEAIQTQTFTSKSDVWSFGIVLWELFSFGEVPYAGLCNAETVDKVLSGYRMPPPEGCPTAMAQLMKACWHQNPQARPSFKEIFESIHAEWIETSRLRLSQRNSYMNNNNNNQQPRSSIGLNVVQSYAIS